MTRVAVDLTALAGIAEAVRRAAHEAEAAGHHQGLHAPSTALVDPALVEAMHSFVDRWGHALRVLVDDAHRLADGLDLVRDLYTSAEVAVAGSLTGAALDLDAPRDQRSVP